MIDLHSHVLPDLDDGARDMPDSMAICRIAAEDGIGTIVATPHSHYGGALVDRELVLRKVEEVNERLAFRGIPIEVLPGTEARVSADFEDLVLRRKILTLNQGPYVLLELDPFGVPAGLDNLLDRMNSAGIGIVLAHPERNLAIQNRPDQVVHWVERSRPWGFLAQLSAESVTGATGYPALKTTRYLLKRCAAHVIATDAHSPFDRPSVLSSAVRAAARLVGEERAFQMVDEIPRAILQKGEFPEFRAPERAKAWWSFG